MSLQRFKSIVRRFRRLLRKQSAVVSSQHTARAVLTWPELCACDLSIPQANCP